MMIREEFKGFKIFMEARENGMLRLWACKHPAGEYCNCSDSGYDCPKEKEIETLDIIEQEILDA